MAWRGLHISNAARLCVRNTRLVVSPEEGEEVSFAMEDLAYVILDTQKITLTASVVAACAGSDCLLVSTDNRHMPNGALVPFHGYHRQAETVRHQIQLSVPQKKRLWQEMVRGKIENQARALELLDKPEQAARLRTLIKKVQSGDKGNTEALAARIYWKHFQQNNPRHPRGGDRNNSILDYGYAILRGCLARNLAAYGFWACLGIHHCNESNPFNLADDLIEPFRPLVDVQAHGLMQDAKDSFDLEDRRAMVLSLHKSMTCNNEQMTTLTAMRRLVEAFRDGIVQRKGRFKLQPWLPLLLQNKE